VAGCCAAALSRTAAEAQAAVLGNRVPKCLLAKHVLSSRRKGYARLGAVFGACRRPSNEQISDTERCSGHACAHARACAQHRGRHSLPSLGREQCTVNLPLGFSAFVHQSSKVCCDGFAVGSRHRVWRGKDGARWRRANQPRILSRHCARPQQTHCCRQER